jgi:hypothetical protein
LSNPDPAKFGPFVQDHHLEIRDMMMRFAEDRLAPGAQERDHAHAFPVDLVNELAALGGMSMKTAAKTTVRGSTTSAMPCPSRRSRALTRPLPWWQWPPTSPPPSLPSTPRRISANASSGPSHAARRGQCRLRSPNPVPARMLPVSRPAPCVMATAGCWTARNSGSPAARRPGIHRVRQDTRRRRR